MIRLHCGPSTMYILFLCGTCDISTVRLSRLQVWLDLCKKLNYYIGDAV